MITMIYNSEGELLKIGAHLLIEGAREIKVIPLEEAEQRWKILHVIERLLVFLLNYVNQNTRIEERRYQTVLYNLLIDNKELYVEEAETLEEDTIENHFVCNICDKNFDIDNLDYFEIIDHYIDHLFEQEVDEPVSLQLDVEDMYKRFVKQIIYEARGFQAVIDNLKEESE